MKNLTVMGSGSWGTTFAKVLADANPEAKVTLWARRDEVAEEIATKHTNSGYLGDLTLPFNITATSDAVAALNGADMVVLAVPAQTLREQLTQWTDAIPADAIIVSLMKGLERGTGLRMTQVVQEVLGTSEDKLVVLSGPNLAREIAREEPTASVVACSVTETADAVAQACTAPYFRPYTNRDVIGAEIGGIVKNIIALAVGMCDGMGMGDNTKATVITRGLAETTRLAVAMGGKAETMSGLAGMGDLVATCASSLSRNYTAGRLFGQGLSMDQVTSKMTQVAEGVKSCSAVLELAHENGVDMPIAAAASKVLDGSVPVIKMPKLLLDRDLKSEERNQ